MNLKLSGPFFISSRLLPAIRFGRGDHVGTVQLAIDGISDDRRVRFKWTIDLKTNDTDSQADEKTFTGNDLHSACRAPMTPATLQEGFAALLDFLTAAGENYRYNMGQKANELNDYSSFPREICEWAYINCDDISMCRLFLGEQQYIEAAA